MRDTAFYLALAGIGALFLGSISAAIRQRLEAWFCVVVGLNFFVQSYMVLEDITWPYIAMPNLFLVVFIVFIFRKWFKSKEQKP